MLLEAGEPLRVNVFMYMPANNNLILFREKGVVLTLEDLLKLKKLPRGRVMARASECELALQEMSGEILAASADGVLGDTAQQVGRAGVRLLVAEGADVKAILDQTGQLVTQILGQYQSVASKKSFEDFIKEVGKGNTALETHNRHVAALSVLVMLTLGKCTQEEVASLAFAASIHDLCLDQCPKSIMDSHLNGEDITNQSSKVLMMDQLAVKYKLHIDLVNKKIVEAKLTMDPGVLKVIAQHHENQDGSGLYKIPGTKIYRPARVLRIVDDLIGLLDSETKPHTLKDAVAILKKINQEGYFLPYDMDILEAIERTMLEGVSA